MVATLTLPALVLEGKQSKSFSGYSIETHSNVSKAVFWKKRVFIELREAPLTWRRRRLRSAITPIARPRANLRDLAVNIRDSRQRSRVSHPFVT